ncbi:MAG: hypothetical protein ACTSU4_01020 [Promethearchaeota archaeon]
MEKSMQEFLTKMVKKERQQAKLTKYITSIGRILLFFLPIILVIITILTLITSLDITLTIIFYIVLIIYTLNSVMLLLGSSFTESSLKMRLNFERIRGRPIDSLEGFKLLEKNVRKVTNLLKIISIICFVAVVLFLLMIIFGDLNIGFAAAGFALVGLGLALLIRSLNLNIHDVNGLQEFYKPTTHQIFLDNFFAEIFSNHLDPVTYLKWDEYLAEIDKILTPSFVESVKKREAEELPITFAIESILFLYYLKYQEVIDDEVFIKELSEIIDTSSKTFDIKKGFKVEEEWYFSTADIFKVFDYIKLYNPGFFTVIDRLQLELADNIARISKDPIYMDSSAQEVVFNNGELNLMIFLYNNSPEAKRYRLKISAPGFDPKEITLDINIEGRGSFEIPSELIPLISQEGIDIVNVLSTMLENGDTTWLTLEPRELGEQTIQVYLESENGTIIEGKTRVVLVTKDLKTKMKKLSSVFSLLGGLAVPLSKILPGMLGISI